MGRFSEYIKDKLPKFLTVLALTEVWERYSYFTLRAINVLFMTNIMKLDDSRAIQTNALVESVGNILPLLTGYLADKFFGFRTMTFVGGFTIGFAHLFLALSYFTDVFFFWGLSTMALGTGIFRGNISNLLGSCYDSYTRLDRIGGFTLFYAGVNLGAFVAFLTGGYFAELISYHFTFSLAGFGMLIGLYIFTYHRKLFLNLDFSGNQNIIKKKFGPLNLGFLLFIITMVISIPTVLLFYYADIVGRINLALWAGIITIILIIYILFSLKDKTERLKFTLLIIYFVYLFIFQALLDLFMDGLLVLYIDRNVYQYLGSLYLPASLVITVNPFIIMLSGFLMSSFYKHQVKHELPRIIFALLSIPIGLLIAYWGLTNANEETHLTSYLYPATATLLMACGEVSIHPLMQAVATVYSPQSRRGIAMGMYLAIKGLSSLLIITFSYIFDVEEDEFGNYDPYDSLQVYKGASLFLLYLFLGCSIFFFITVYPVILIQRKLKQFQAQEISNPITVSTKQKASI